MEAAVLFGVSVEAILTQDKHKFPEYLMLNGVSIGSLQSGADIVFPERLILRGVSIEMVIPKPTQARRRRMILQS